MADVHSGALTREYVISAGGWHSRFARVLLIEQSGDQALVLVDGNGDGAELEVEYWKREVGAGWQSCSSSGYGSQDSLKAAETWNSGESVYAVGRADPGSEIRIRYDNSVYRRQANEFGVWGFVHPCPQDSAPQLTVL